MVKSTCKMRFIDYIKSKLHGDRTNDYSRFGFRNQSLRTYVQTA